jgi:hypothetical protein
MKRMRTDSLFMLGSPSMSEYAIHKRDGARRHKIMTTHASSIPVRKNDAQVADGRHFFQELTLASCAPFR